MVQALLFVILSGVTVQAQARDLPWPDNGQWLPGKVAIKFDESRVCQSTREYITALHYLRSEQQNLGIPEARAQELSEQVAQGCTGAAKRFVQVVKFMQRLQMGSLRSVEYGVRAAQSTEVTVEAFVGIFKQAYFEHKLNLSLQQALELAERMSFDFKGDHTKVVNDYAALVRFCLDPQALDLSKPDCALLAKRLVEKTEKHSSTVVQAFLRIFDFLTQDVKGPNLPTYQAIQVAEDILTLNPGALENFMQGFQFAQSQKGLNLNRAESVDFALRMIKYSVPQ